MIYLFNKEIFKGRSVLRDKEVVNGTFLKDLNNLNPFLNFQIFENPFLGSFDDL